MVSPRTDATCSRQPNQEWLRHVWDVLSDPKPTLRFMGLYASTKQQEARRAKRQSARHTLNPVDDGTDGEQGIKRPTAA
jgi:hypothetical protein